MSLVIGCLVTHSLAAQPLDTLTVNGKDIVDGQGRVVSMRGTNFGGWLMMETWIPSIEMEWHDHLPRLAREAQVEEALAKAMEAVGPFNDDQQNIHVYIGRLHADLQQRVDETQFARYMELYRREPPVFAAKEMDQLLRKRFGDYGAAEVWNAYHDTWITETDFQLAKALGFNFVRLPFWYRWFENNDEPYPYSEYGFQYLDRAIAWAKEHRLYVMLDFHGAVGGQSPWDHTGELSRGELFVNEEFQARTCRLWHAIADRYKSEATVFAYDALNEPFSATGRRDWIKVHDAIYRSIRRADPRTIVVMEDGYKLEEVPWKHNGFFPIPEKMNWQQVVYSFHFYSGADPLFTDDEGLADHGKRAEEVARIGDMEQQRCNVPIYIGEFSTMNDHPNDIEGMRRFLTLFNQKGWHWSPWTFKYVDDDREGTIWGIYQYNRKWQRTPNMHRDSKQSILDTIRLLRLSNFSLHEDYASVLRSCLVQPVSSAKAPRGASR